jgi:hypothetical protein
MLETNITSFLWGGDACTAENGCGVHVHEGFDCTDVESQGKWCCTWVGTSFEKYQTTHFLIVCLFVLLIFLYKFQVDIGTTMKR